MKPFRVETVAGAMVPPPTGSVSWVQTVVRRLLVCPSQRERERVRERERENIHIKYVHK